MRNEIIHGNVLDPQTWGTIPAGSVHCVVTSPPYWALRDYGVDGQLGLEATPEEYIARMVEGSANLTANPRLDNYVMTNDRAVYDFHRQWVEEVLTA